MDPGITCVKPAGASPARHGVWALGALLDRMERGPRMHRAATLIWMQLEETSQIPCGSCYPGIIPSQQKALG